MHTAIRRIAPCRSGLVDRDQVGGMRSAVGWWGTTRRGAPLLPRGPPVLIASRASVTPSAGGHLAPSLATQHLCAFVSCASSLCRLECISDSTRYTGLSQVSNTWTIDFGPRMTGLLLRLDRLPITNTCPWFVQAKSSPLPAQHATH